LINRKNAQNRNRLMLELADKIAIDHISEGGAAGGAVER
jgi:hypothetical protein